MGLRFNYPILQIIVADKIRAADAFKAGLMVSLDWLNPLSRSAVLALSQSDLETALHFTKAFASDIATRQGSHPAWDFKAA